MDWTRFLAFIGQFGHAIDAMLAKGDELAREYPELAPQWQVQRAALIAARDNQTNAARFQQEFDNVLALLLGGEGPIGPSQAVHGA